MHKSKFFDDGRRVPEALPKEELEKLFEEAKNGSQEAKNKLVIHNIRLVLYMVTKKFFNVDYDKKDLVSIGNIGLIKAVNTYDPSKGIKFSVYASRCVENEILMFLKKRNRKSETNVDSLEDISFQGKDGKNLKLEDKLSDSSDFTMDYENAQINEIIRQLVEGLPEKDREIIKLRFGFYDDKVYSQKQIAKKIHFSRSQVSRIISKNVEILRKELETRGIVDSSYNERKEKMKRLQSIYEYLYEYTKEQIDDVLSKLSDEDKALLVLRYGENLEMPVQTKMPPEAFTKFYSVLIPKIKRQLNNNSKKSKAENVQPIQNTSLQVENNLLSSNTLEESATLPIQKITKTRENPLISRTETNKEVHKPNDITREDGNKILELLRTPTFMQMMSALTVKEAVIISLRLGYVDGKYFSTESIANFLGIEEEEVKDAVKKVLLIYKENINSFLDSLIQTASEEPLSRKLENKKDQKIY